MRNLSSALITFTPFLSDVRLIPYRLTFDISNDHELMGAYLWSQHTASALYPLFHFVEIFVRNSIDKEAKKRFGEFWWDKIDYNDTEHTSRKFISNIENAKENLRKAWIKAEKKKSRSKSYQTLENECPNFSHDQIVAATEFSTWTFILTNGFVKPRHEQNSNKKYLWPKSLGKIFKNFNILDSSPYKALKPLHDNLTDIRNYRNRIFHHEPIWIKGDTSNLNSIRAIETIRHKVSKMEDFIKIVDPNLHKELMEMNLFNNVRRICSIQELEIYQGKSKEILAESEFGYIFDKKKIQEASSKTLCIEYDNQIFGLMKVL